MRVCVIGPSWEARTGALQRFREHGRAEAPGWGRPVSSLRVRSPTLENEPTGRVDLALVVVEAPTDDRLILEAPAIVDRDTPSVRAHAPDHGP